MRKRHSSAVFCRCGKSDKKGALTKKPGGDPIPTCVLYYGRPCITLLYDPWCREGHLRMDRLFFFERKKAIRCQSQPDPAMSKSSIWHCCSAYSSADGPGIMMMSMSTYCLKEAAKALDWVFGGDLIISAGEVSWLSLCTVVAI